MTIQLQMANVMEMDIKFLHFYNFHFTLFLYSARSLFFSFSLFHLLTSVHNTYIFSSHYKTFRFTFCVLYILTTCSFYFNVFFSSLLYLQAFVRYCVRHMDIMVAVCAIVKRAGKAPNVTYQQMNARYQVATVMAGVLMVIVIANVDGKDSFVINVSKMFNHCCCLIVH